LSEAAARLFKSSPDPVAIAGPDGVGAVIQTRPTQK